VNQKQAHRLGVDSGLEATQHGDFTPQELRDEEAFMEACSQACENKRQYADHPGYEFNRQGNAELLWEAFEHSEAVGIRRGWRRRSKEIRQRQASFRT
jgi:hypothetical protein